ncbi:hypothetical protein MPER_14999, partial [Moniliophthora perniciosa FA553]
EFQRHTCFTVLTALLRHSGRARVVNSKDRIGWDEIPLLWVVKKRKELDV